MSDGANGEENSLPNGPFSRTISQKSSNIDENDNDESANQPDLGLGNQPQGNRKSSNDSQPGPSEVPRREENPFSFKHFLSRESANGQSGSHSTGAKPKVFTSPTSTHPPDIDYNRTSSNRSFTANPDLASALPDFVQDHLVVEQCFLRDNASSALSVDLDNLPDFTVNKDLSNGPSLGARPRHPNYNNYNRRRERSQNNSMEGVPLDLPSISSPPSALDLPSAGVLPFDLPLVRDGGASNVPGNNSSSSSPVQPSVSKSLPDFLSDGPIRGGHLPPADVTAEASTVAQNHSSDDRFQTENERLRAEMEMLRRQNSELSRRVSSLQSEVRTLRTKEHEDTLTMEKALEQAEENLQRTMKRAVNAENMVTKLKQELKQSQSEIRRLQQDNLELRSGEGASGAWGGASNFRPAGFPEQQVQMQRFAQELKAAALTAETSLRQLLSGVDNLRLLASTMESVHRVEDRTQDYLSDSDDASGPTL
ncbi:Endosome-associated-trafficking regulator 1 [Frankliniella fusca]|uniref:Endosome-associated-trafficking regulator 1 n=1 Tax=Frankliniella fusca TaxID=407009 RepID=A0AAE1H1J4_9NEOP|nr:Endosome-associated-trafficking regulator 1 [Frankliniella fusca]